MTNIKDRIRTFFTSDLPNSLVACVGKEWNLLEYQRQRRTARALLSFNLISLEYFSGSPILKSPENSCVTKSRCALAGETVFSQVPSHGGVKGIQMFSKPVVEASFSLIYVENTIRYGDHVNYTLYAGNNLLIEFLVACVLWTIANYGAHHCTDLGRTFGGAENATGTSYLLTICFKLWDNLCRQGTATGWLVLLIICLLLLTPLTFFNKDSVAFIRTAEENQTFQVVEAEIYSCS